MQIRTSKFLSLFFACLLIAPIFAVARQQAKPTAGAVAGSDWVEWRGPMRDGTSSEKGLPEKWSPKGENLVWKAPFGGRSAAIVMGNRVFMFNTAGEGETMQERVLSLDADTGKVL